jgi:hypothetical protein
MGGKSFFIPLLVVASALANSSAAAQEDPDLAPPLPVPGAASSVPASAEAFGLGNQLLEMPATLFTGKLTPGTELVYVGNHFYQTAGLIPRRFYAAIPLPGGARIFQIECHVRDDSAVNDVTLVYQRYGFDTNADQPVLGFNRTWSTNGSAGYEDIYYFPDEADGTIVHGEGSIRYTYYLAVDVTSETSFRGCLLAWRRMVSEAPAVATFPADVPTTHPYFRFIEALAAAGITGGCGPQQYCPNQAITRGEMAVFLAAALGLHFPF